MVELFDYVGMVFSRNEKKWEELSVLDKSRNFFMLNRFLSINYPIQVSYLSHYKIDSVSVSDYWHRTLSKQFSGTPKWIYAKTVKKTEVEKKLNLPSKEMINWYCRKNEMTISDFNQHVNFFGESFIDEIKSLEKILKSQGVINA